MAFRDLHVIGEMFDELTNRHDLAAQAFERWSQLLAYKREWRRRNAKRVNAARRARRTADADTLEAHRAYQREWNRKKKERCPAYRARQLECWRRWKARQKQNALASSP